MEVDGVEETEGLGFLGGGGRALFGAGLDEMR